MSAKIYPAPSWASRLQHAAIAVAMMGLWLAAGLLWTIILPNQSYGQVAPDRDTTVGAIGGELSWFVDFADGQVGIHDLMFVAENGTLVDIDNGDLHRAIGPIRIRSLDDPFPPSHMYVDREGSLWEVIEARVVERDGHIYIVIQWTAAYRDDIDELWHQWNRARDKGDDALAGAVERKIAYSLTLAQMNRLILADDTEVRIHWPTTDEWGELQWENVYTAGWEALADASNVMHRYVEIDINDLLNSAGALEGTIINNDSRLGGRENILLNDIRLGERAAQRRLRRASGHFERGLKVLGR